VTYIAPGDEQSGVSYIPIMSISPEWDVAILAVLIKRMTGLTSGTALETFCFSTGQEDVEEGAYLYKL
jgi:hypothetical protein